MRMTIMLLCMRELCKTWKDTNVNRIYNSFFTLGAYKFPFKFDLVNLINFIFPWIASGKIELDHILVGAAKGLLAVHSSGFIHWDFQARNLLLMKVCMWEYFVPNEKRTNIIYVAIFTILLVIISGRNRKSRWFWALHTEECKDGFLWW